MCKLRSSSLIQQTHLYRDISLYSVRTHSNRRCSQQRRSCPNHHHRLPVAFSASLPPPPQKLTLTHQFSRPAKAFSAFLPPVLSFGRTLHHLPLRTRFQTL